MNKKLGFVLGVVAVMSITCVSAFAGQVVPITPIDIDLTGVDFMSVFQPMLNLIPVLLPAILAFVGFRKAFGFLKSTIKGA